MKSVCVLLTVTYPFTSGESFLESEIDSLSRAFDEVRIFAYGPKKNAKPTRPIPENVIAKSLNLGHKDAITATLIGLFSHRNTASGTLKKRLYRDYCFGMARKIISAIKPALSFLDEAERVVFYSYWFNYTCTAAIDLSRYAKEKWGIPVAVVSRAHRHDLYSWVHSDLGHPTHHYNFQGCNAIFPCSADGAKHLIDVCSAPSEKVHVGYLGVMDREGVLGDLGAKTFLMIAPFREVKRVPFFARSFALFAKRNRDWRWVHIGGTLEENAEIRKIVEDNGLSGRVEFLGELSNQEVHAYLQSHKISYLVNTSSSEGLPVSMMEAFSYGIPCIGLDIGGVSEIIDGSNGFLLPANMDEAGLAEALKKAVALAPKKYESLAKMAQSTQRVKFSAKPNFDAFAATISKMPN